MHRILTRECWRRLRYRKQIEASLDAEPVAQAVMARETRGDTERLLQLLSPKQRAVFYLGSVEGYCDREIGQRLGMAAATVRVHKYRARRRLQAELAAAGEHLGYGVAEISIDG